MEKQTRTFKATIAIASVLLASGVIRAQTIENINSNPRAWSDVIPGFNCKTRTNDSSAVRNLAKGVFNQDSATPVAVNCGWIVPQAWVIDVFDNNARIDGDIAVVWIRTAGTPKAQANDAFCSIFAANTDSPTSPPNVAGTMLGTVGPNFEGNQADAESDVDRVLTAGLDYPNVVSGVDSAMFTAFCRIPQGVRLQAFLMNGTGVGSHP